MKGKRQVSPKGAFDKMLLYFSPLFIEIGMYFLKKNGLI